VTPTLFFAGQRHIDRKGAARRGAARRRGGRRGRPRRGGGGEGGGGEGGGEAAVRGPVADRDADPVRAEARERVAPADREAGLAEPVADAVGLDVEQQERGGGAGDDVDAGDGR
jgi:hypothetical protein